MAVDSKYGVINIGGIPTDEPVFVLRARDVFAVKILEDYKDLRSSAGDKEGVESVELTIKRFQAWPKKELPT